jgi:hypothetical protein
MVTITPTTITRDEVRRAFRRTRDIWLREQYHGMLLLMDSQERSRDGTVIVPRRGHRAGLGACLQP